MAEIERGLIDTTVVIGLESIDQERLPKEMAISAVTLAELSAGPFATFSADERAHRQLRLQLAEANFEPIPFDANCARAYGRVDGADAAVGRMPRGARAVDLMIAATALGIGLPLFTRNPSNFAGLENLVEIVAVA